MKQIKYTYDIIRRDSFPPQILIRYSRNTDSEGDTFHSLKDCRDSISTSLLMDIYVSAEILEDLF